MKEKDKNTHNSPRVKRLVVFSKEHSWVSHVIIWGLIFLFPLVFKSWNLETISWDWYIGFTFMMLTTMLVFYANYSYLITKILFKGRWLQYILYNVALTLVVSTCIYFILDALPRPAGLRPLPENIDIELFHLRMFFNNMTRFIVVIFISLAIKATSSWYESESGRKELEKINSEAELQSLKSQLNPHFLFNTLNNIYSLIAFSPEKAQEAVHDLSRLLRYVMYDSSNATVSLSKELEFVQNYIELMRIRLPKEVDIVSDISCIRPNELIAPLLFISLIENAFKHGVSNNKPSFIHIKIYQEGSETICYIENSYFPKDNQTDKSGSGIGLNNLQKRLELIYPNSHSLKCGKKEDNYNSYLSIKFNESIS